MICDRGINVDVHIAGSRSLRYLAVNLVKPCESRSESREAYWRRLAVDIDKNISGNPAQRIAGCRCTFGDGGSDGAESGEKHQNRLSAFGWIGRRHRREICVQNSAGPDAV